MAAPAYQLYPQKQLRLQPVNGAGKKTAAKRRSAATHAFLLFVAACIALSLWQTVQIHRLAQETHALREAAFAVQLEQERIYSDIRERL